MTWASHSRLPSSTLPILANCACSFFNCAGASSTCLPVYVIFMGSPPGGQQPKTPPLPLYIGCGRSVPDAPLVRGWNFHIFAILGHGTTRDVDALRLQQGGDLLVSQRLAAILLLDHPFHHSLQ